MLSKVLGLAQVRLCSRAPAFPFQHEPGRLIKEAEKLLRGGSPCPWRWLRALQEAENAGRSCLGWPGRNTLWVCDEDSDYWGSGCALHMPIRTPLFVVRQASHFAAFLHKCIQGQVGRIALYVDEVVPGNNLPPDHARAFYAWFWTFLEWPHWYRSRQFGWFDLCVMKAKDVHAIPGGVSALAVHILKMFWDPTGLMHMENLGVRVAGPREPWSFRAKFALWLMDERPSCKGVIRQ